MMNKAFAYQSIIMSVLFLGMAGLLAFYPKGIFLNLDGYQRYMIAFILVVYGIFRFYRAYKVLKSKS